MKCPRCFNEDEKYIFQLDGHYYCRKCIPFTRVDINECRKTLKRRYPKRNIDYHLNFELSQRQKEISTQLVSNYKQHIHSYVYAVCGSGKTEIVFEVICYALSRGHRVCFTIPRKELVVELYTRIKDSFENIDIGVLYGGVKENEDAQMIVCTTHQLYRFENRIGFDLMIGDEVDAFPFYGNEVLQALFTRCCLGSFIKLSATFSTKDIVDGKLIMMNRRYHGYDLPIPIQIISFYSILKVYLLFILKMLSGKWIVYVPTIEIGEKLYRFLKKWMNNVAFVSSQSENNEDSIEKLKTTIDFVLISTTLLERGITVENVHVIVYLGEHPIFDQRTLVQIAGRVGRKPNHPKGYVIILCSHRDKEVKECIKTIKHLNKMSV